jgi:hypothetical protein
MIKTLQLCTVTALLLLAGCKKDLKKEVKPAAQSTKTVTMGAYQSALPYNLNVVYFIPTDVAARPEYERRVSQTLLAAQEFYRLMMHNWGFGDKTFGLLVNPLTNRVKINVVYGSLPIASYNNGAGPQILSEVNAWFAAHPGNKTSDHILVFTATPSMYTEIPYYGLGKNCFVGDNEQTDYQYFNENSQMGTNAKAYMGGFLHELGHCLGLPHDALGLTLKNTPGYGTSLMGTGNATYGFSSTILTKASCAILNNCQLFSATLKPDGYFYAGGKTFTINTIYHSFVNGKINVWGSYTVNSPINGINAYFNPINPYLQFSTTNYTPNTFSFSADTADLYPSNNYQVVLQALFLDGTVAWQTYDFKFINGQPVLGFMTELDRSAWTVTSSSAYSVHPPSLAIDGDVNTYWHTNFAAGSVQTDPVPGQAQTFPYYFDINMGASKSLWGLTFTQHQGLVRTAKNIYVYTRPTTNDGWTLQGSYDLKNDINKQYVLFSQNAVCRYIRIVFYSAYDGLPYVAMPEIGAI